MPSRQDSLRGASLVVLCQLSDKSKSQRRLLLCDPGWVSNLRARGQWHLSSVKGIPRADTSLFPFTTPPPQFNQFGI